MILFKKAEQLSDFLIKEKYQKQNIGFVPTMGALHPGHLHLIKSSTDVNDVTVCSIFVNPTQFNDPDDFKKYPVTIEKDIALLESSESDVLFLPSVSEIYPDGLNELIKFELGILENVLEGEFRPGHFQGVCQVVHRLLKIVNPDILYLGQKDFQQCLVIKKLLNITGLDSKITIKIEATIRETDGLAMSSRNRRLSNEARKKATAINQALLFVKENLKKGSTEKVLYKASRMLISKGFTIDYLKIADAETLVETDNWDGELKIVVLTAVFIEGVRLIDNRMIN